MRLSSSYTHLYNGIKPVRNRKQSDELPYTGISDRQIFAGMALGKDISPSQNWGTKPTELTECAEHSEASEAGRRLAMNKQSKQSHDAAFVS